VSEKGIDGEVAGDFATGGSSHAIAYYEGPGCERGGTGVLVAAANLTAVGEHGVDEFIGSHSTKHKNLVRRKQYTLRR
jgi:hypothetical protein